MATERDAESYAIIGAAMAVHRGLGCGFLEAVYRDALAVELRVQGIPHVREAALPVFYRGEAVGAGYRADFICFDSIIVEIKALGKLSSVEHVQVINYLKASRLTRALLLNFARASLEYQRLVFSHSDLPQTGRRAE